MASSNPKKKFSRGYLATIAAVVGAVAALLTVILGQGGIVGLVRGFYEINLTSKTPENLSSNIDVKNNNNSQAKSQGGQSNLSIKQEPENNINEFPAISKPPTPQSSPISTTHKALVGRWEFLGLERGEIGLILAVISGIEFFENGDCLLYYQSLVYDSSVRSVGAKYEVLSHDKIKIDFGESNYTIYSVSLLENILKLEDASLVLVFQQSETIESKPYPTLFDAFRSAN
jgi:hypothetical protein